MPKTFTTTKYVIQKTSDTGPHPEVGTFVAERPHTAEQYGFDYTGDITKARIYPTTGAAIEDIRDRDAAYPAGWGVTRRAKFSILPVTVETTTKVTLQ